MSKKPSKKTGAELKREELERAHGKQSVKLAEIDCKIMRIEGGIERAMARGEGEEFLSNLRAHVGRLMVKRSGLLDDMIITQEAIDALRAQESPFSCAVQEREVFEVQVQLLLE